MTHITDTDRLRWLAENGSSIRDARDCRRNALVWDPVTYAERADRLGTLRKAVDHKIRREKAQEAAR